MKTKKQQEDAAIAVDQAQESGKISIGSWYAVVTVSPIYHGKLVGMTTEHYFLEEAAWVVETGRLSEFVVDPQKTCKEAEYVGNIPVERGAVMALYPTPAGKITTR